jgi:glycerol-1-phosphate dehydrogenase [NAD(P)+]
MEISNATCNLFIKYASGIKQKNEEAWNVFMQSMMHDGIFDVLGAPLGGSEHRVGDIWVIQKKGKIYHGEGVGLGTILMAYHYGKKEGETAKKALKDVGAPTTAKQLGITDGEVINALVTASEESRKGSYSILTDKPLTKESAKNLAERSGVID